ncbi:18S rRNA (guanine-N(7))-methyltransferase RID2-like isoform X2 [Cornus florida]|uniref:18S rRNA (guanine-N(7))-methyltransferase RID2-like isoform X2 n=1 Tax=Cornus florida TaxID=4283 RepID=UPI00289D2601|nr:18S rRNA (guanine-N(7))-methyltransferase RID2-like isoform X2 [Cornus florida]
MSSRPELEAPPEIFYNDSEARKYTSSSRIIEIQAKLSERALELLALPDDGVPRLLLDIGCGSGLSGETISENGHQWIGLDISQSMLDVALEREVEGDLILGDMGQGLGLRSGVIDGVISISAIQWLCNADKSSHEPRLRLNTKKRKEYLVLTCGPPSLSTATPKGKGEEEESCSDDESSGDDENETICKSDRNRPRKRQKIAKKVKGRDWVLKKKDQMRKKGNVVPRDTKYTARKRKARF